MNDSFKVAEDLIDPKKRSKTILIIFIGLFLLGIAATVTSYCSKIGEQASKEQVKKGSNPAGSDQGKTSISQHTEGENSPAIVSDNVTVTYGPNTKP